MFHEFQRGFCSRSCLLRRQRFPTATGLAYESPVASSPKESLRVEQTFLPIQMNELPQRVISAILDLDDESFDIRREAANILFENPDCFPMGSPQLNDIVEYLEKHVENLEDQSRVAQSTFLHLSRLVVKVLNKSYEKENERNHFSDLFGRILHLSWHLVKARDLSLNLREPGFTILADLASEKDAKDLISLYKEWKMSSPGDGNDREIHMKTIWKILEKYPSLIQRLQRLKRRLTRLDPNDERIIYLSKYLDTPRRHFTEGS